jgi:hypothetical protein
MKRHIKIVAGLYLVLGVLGIIAALVVFGMLGGMPDFAARDDHPAAMIVLLGGIATLAIVTVSVPSIITGIGLLKFQSWARVLSIILSVVHLFNIPFGTALGVYGLWVMQQPETQLLFQRQKARPASIAA